jgi:hypothetical protein
MLQTPRWTKASPDAASAPLTTGWRMLRSRPAGFRVQLPAHAHERFLPAAAVAAPGAQEARSRNCGFGIQNSRETVRDLKFF